MKLHQQAICRECRTEFDVPATGRKPKYCSAKCKQKAYRKRNGENVTKVSHVVGYNDCRYDHDPNTVKFLGAALQVPSYGLPFREMKNGLLPGASVCYFRKPRGNEMSVTFGDVEIFPFLLFAHSYDPEVHTDIVLVASFDDMTDRDLSDECAAHEWRV